MKTSDRKPVLNFADLINKVREFAPFCRTAVLTACLAAASGLHAQQPAPSTTPATSSSASEDVMIMTPFTVNTDADTGYTALNTLAGSRLNTSLKDTAASLSVLTAQFISDIGANSLEEAMAWTTNSQLDQQETITLASVTADDNSTYYSFGGFRVRGLPATTTRNYFTWRLPSDSYNIERVEEARGPNSILFGIGSAGGVVNTSTKRALLGRNIRHATVQAGSHDSYRGTVDINQQIGKQLAVRFNGVYTESNSFREYVRSDNRIGHVAATYSPWSKTRFRAEYETGIIDQVTAANDPVSDQFSNWTAGSRLITTPIPAAENAAYGVARFGAGVQVYYISNNQSLMNLANSYRSLGTDNFAMLYDPALGDPSVNTGGPGSTRRADFETASLFVEQQFGKDTFIELAYNRQDNYSRAYQPAGNSRRLYADPNATLPNGQLNPFAGQYLLEGETWTWDPGRKIENYRGTVSTDLDFGKWGKLRLAGLVEREERRNPENSFVEVWEGSPFHADPENTANQVHRRSYVTPGDWGSFYRTMPKQGLIRGLVDPITGRTLNSTMVPRAQNGTRDVGEEQDTQLIAVQARLLKERLVLGMGYRWDTLDTENFGSLRNPTTRMWEVDYSAPTSSTTYDGRTKTFGAVGHITKNLSVFYNKSDNFGIPGSALVLPNSERAGNPEAIGQDYGLALDLFDGKLFARASYYEVDLQNGSGFGYGGTLTNPSSISRIILDALVNQSIITEAQAAPHRSSSTGSTFNRLVEGYELNLTANPTRNWRLQANFSITDGFVSNIAPEVKTWITEHMPFLQTPAYQNVVTGNQAMTVAQVIEDFFEYHNDQLEGEGLVLPGNRKYKWNVFTTYSFLEGALRGFMVGGGYNWQSKLPVGIIGPGELRYSNSIWNTNLMLGYRFRNIEKLPWIKNLRLQLNVLNVTDDDEPMIIRYASNEAGNAGYNIIRRQRPKDPRTWRMTASFDF